MKKLDLYIAAAVVLVSGLYLKSPIVCLGAIVLWGVFVAENILTKASKDAEIMDLLERMAKIEKEHKVLTADIVNVAERSKQILGEVY